MDRPETCPQAMACRMDLMNIAAALYCQDRYINVIFCITELFHCACNKKTFCILIRFNTSAPELTDMPRKNRYKTSALKINFFGMQKQKTAAENCRNKTQSPLLYLQIESLIAEDPDKTEPRQQEFDRPRHPDGTHQ